jgi:cell division protein FtsL
MFHHRLQNPHEYRPKSRLAAFLVFVCVTVLIVINVILSAELSHLGSRLAVSEKRTQMLEETSKKIQEEVALNTSLTDLAMQAVKMGYSREIQYVNLPDTTVVAQRP